MKASVAELAGLLLACGGAAAALADRNPRRRYVAIWAALIAAPALIAGDVWEQPRFADVRDDAFVLALAGLGTAAAIAALALLLARFPGAFCVLAFALVPFRVPVQIGGETSNLLVPLYLLVAAGAARGAHAAFRGSLAERADPGAAGRWLLRLLAVSVALYGIQAAYSEHVSNAIENAGFFLVPFAVLCALLLDVRWTPRLAGRVLLAAVAAALLFAVVALWQYAARDLIFNDELLEANQLHTYFRVNSLFHDPNVLGRYLALVFVAIGAYVCWQHERRNAFLASGAGLVVLAALVMTFSLTSFAALLAGLVVVAALRWGPRAGTGALATIVLAGSVYLLAGNSDVGSQRDPTSGRADLVSGGLELAEDRPLWGWGSGSFGAAFERRIERAKTTTSHSEPITVAAEQGAIGVVAYLALLAAALAALLPGAGASVVRTAVAGCFAAMVVHSLGYAGFVIDPATWALLGLGIAFPRPD